MCPTATDIAIVHPVRRVRGTLQVPGDKSISHRYAMLAALAGGPSRITGFAPGADCAATVTCLQASGVHARWFDEAGKPGLEIHGRGLGGLTPSSGPLDARNSGTTMRLLAGVMAAHPFETVIVGDASLSRRPMRRVIEPLERMGARIAAHDGRPPLRVTGGRLRGIDYALPVASAQVKSAILLAGLQAEGDTVVEEPAATRDHTERALRVFGAVVRQENRRIILSGGQRLQGRTLDVPGDLSSASFWIAAAAALPGSDLEIVQVGLNPSRTALLATLRHAGADIQWSIASNEGEEPRGTLRVRYAPLRPLVLGPADVPALIDELPALAALATAGGEITVTGAAELRVKESDRIAALVGGLRRFGAEAEEFPDGFHIRGANRLTGGSADAAGDHRLAMAFAVAALGAAAPCTINGAGAVVVSYPGFFDVLRTIGE